VNCVSSQANETAKSYVNNTPRHGDHIAATVAAAMSLGVCASVADEFELAPR
jgi:hypothetical protein